MDREAVLAEYVRRQESRFRPDQFCFKEQLALITDEAKYSTAVCTRRAGKTIACAVDLVWTALKFPGVVTLYITLSRSNAKKLVWPEILRLNRIFNLGGRPDNTELSLHLPNGSVVYCSGAKDKSEIEKFRGLPIKLAYIDEAQSFRSYIEDLIDDVLSAALFDYDGKLRLIGTPGPVPTGYFHKAAHSDEWNHHFWTLVQNPHIKKKSGKDPMDMILAECKRRGVELTDPKIQREFFGKWVVDIDSLVFKYSAEKNHFESLPTIAAPNKKWNYVIGVDIGHDDADAIAVIAWHDHLRESFLVDEVIKTKQGVTELAQDLARLIEKYDPLKVVMDTGGLGKKIAAELQKRFTLPIVAAEKQRKFEYIELLNDALRTGRFMAKKTSAFAGDCSLIEWDRDKEKPDRKVISERFHSDIADAVMYGWREALHWMHEEPVKQPEYRSPEWVKQEEERMIAQLERELHEQRQGEWEESLL